MSLKSSSTLIVVKNPNNEDIKFKSVEPNISKINCEFHSSAKGDFFCLDCLTLVCKYCYVNNHKQHDAHVPNEIIKNFLKKLNSSIVDLENEKPKILDIINKINEKNKMFVDNKNQLSKKLDNLRANTNSNINEFYDNMLYNLYTNIYLGNIGGETNNIASKIKNSLNKTKSVIDSYNENITDLESIKKSNKNSKDFIACEYIKNNINNINNCEEKNNSIEAVNQIEGFSNILNKDNAFFDKNLISIQNELDKINTKLFNSLNTGVSLLKFFIRRFNSFNTKDINQTYFDKSCLKLKVDNNIVLLGLNICGQQYISNKNTDIKAKLEIMSLKEKNNDIFKKELETSFDFKKIKASYNNDDNRLYINSDPTFTLFFDKPVELSNKFDYLIEITNLNKEKYVNLYSGNTITDKFFNHQSVYCNNSEVKFRFERYSNSTSDFDELSYGIISDLIFTNV